MALFEWSEECSVSVLRFDKEHQKLFSLINELHEAMSQGRGRFVVVRVLQELGEYVRWHCRGEESAMRRAGFAGLEEHIAEHRQFEAKISEFYAEYGEGKSGIPIDVLYYLRDWLTNHILHTDHQYIEALNRAGIH